MLYGCGNGPFRLTDDDNGYVIGSSVFCAGFVAGTLMREPADVGDSGSDRTLRPSELSTMLESSSGMDSWLATNTFCGAKSWL